MSDTKLLPCPFCGGTLAFKAIPHTGYGASGMELPDWKLGCQPCGIWSEQVRGSEWIPGRGTLDLEQEAKATLTAAWSRRPSPWQPIASAPKDGTRIIARNKYHAFVVEWWEGEWLMASHAISGLTHWMPLPQPPK